MDEQRFSEWMSELNKKVDSLLRSEAASKNKRLECQEHFDKRYPRKWLMSDLYMWIMIAGLIVNIVITLSNGG